MTLRWGPPKCTLLLLFFDPHNMKLLYKNEEREKLTKNAKARKANDPVSHSTQNRI